VNKVLSSRGAKEVQIFTLNRRRIFADSVSLRQSAVLRPSALKSHSAVTAASNYLLTWILPERRIPQDGHRRAFEGRKVNFALVPAAMERKVVAADFG